MIARALSRNQRECLDQAARHPTLQRTRGGYQGEGAQGKDRLAYFKARTVFALEREGLLAAAEPGSAARYRITGAGRAEVPHA